MREKSQGLLKNINFCSILNVTSEKRYLIIVLQTKKPRVAARGFFYSFLQGKCRASKSYKVNAGYSNHIDSNLCLCYYYLDAAVAQVVAHLIGSEEVTGPSPVSSFIVLSFKAYFFV